MHSRLEVTQTSYFERGTRWHICLVSLKLSGGDESLCDGNATPNDPNGRIKSGKAAARHEQLVKAMTGAMVEGVSGEVMQIPTESGIPLIKSRKTYQRLMAAGAESNSMAKSNAANERLNDYLLASKSAGTMAKEWTLGNPVTSGLVPFDLEAPSKLIWPRPTPLRNSLPRLSGQGSSRRFKVISGVTGSGTGGQTTIQPGFNETSTNTGPGGLAYIRPPYISYAGYDVSLPYVSYGLSDSVSWQAEFQGEGFEDIRSLSATSLLFSTMLLEERLLLYGRSSQTGYVGALGTPTITSCTAVSASITPQGSSTLGTSATVWVIVAADAGDLLGTNGVSMHQGPSTTVGTTASVTTSAGLTAVQVNIGSDVAGALGYNIYAASVQAGPYYYAGRTGYNVGYVTSQPTGGPSTTSGAADASAVTNNFDGMLTSLAASASYVKRLNAPFSTTNPGVEYQTAFATLYEDTKADPDEIWLNGFDRLQLSNALLNNSSTNAYRVFIDDQAGTPNVKVGAVVATVLNEVTGKAVDVKVHPWMPQGNSMIRSISLPLPNSNVSETFAWAGPQDYSLVNWAPQQFSWDSSTIIIGTLCSYAPTYSALLQGIQGVGASQVPPSFGDS